ncbi:hypothetical protein F5Y04DRAFT_251747 [Hypomontagnella monticulosa]|nr:hypothetical protein F5Y04DRAFT_251747 [Hypomontagnella monticulosa]
MVPASAPEGAAAAGSSTNPKLENDNGSPSRNIYEDALDRLQPLQPVLHGFNHRNRNQHRRAAWWAAFGMLRRHIDKLVDELLEYTTVAAAAKSKSSKKRKRIDDKGEGEDKAEKRAEKKVRDYVEWLRDVLVPKCYLAFSQLTADNQFAALGVVLLGALAQVNAACTKIVGEATAEARQEHGFATPGIGGILTKGLADSSSKDSDFLTGHDETLKGLDRQGGAVISRDEVAKAEKLRRKNTKLGGKTQSGTFDNALDNLSSNQYHDDAPSTDKPQKQTSKAHKEADGATSKEAKPAKKKKKTKKGDEFDNLFKGLF